MNHILFGKCVIQSVVSFLLNNSCQKQHRVVMKMVSNVSIIGLWFMFVGILICLFFPSSITVDEDGFVSVNFDWMNRTYNIGKSERKTVVIICSNLLINNEFLKDKTILVKKCVLFNCIFFLAHIN